MNRREAFLRVLRKEEPTGSKRLFPPDIELTPPKLEEFGMMNTGKTVEEYFGLFHRSVELKMTAGYEGNGKQLFSGQDMPADFEVDPYGTAMSKGSEACMHMVHFHPPLTGERTTAEIMNHPLPEVSEADYKRLSSEVKEIRNQGLAVRAWLEQTIWERSWLIRGMEDLMMDMMLDKPHASLLFDRITEHSCRTARILASAGVDLIALGDDIGMQSTPMMDPKLWMRYLQPRLARVIGAAKSENPEVIISYHSCGHATPFIEGLIDAGVEVLNPLQPESMDVAGVYRKHNSKLAFWGAIGTQTTMPFGSPVDVRQAVMDTARLSDDQRGFLIAPTHIIEPEVPWDNLHAYIGIMNELNGF